MNGVLVVLGAESQFLIDEDDYSSPSKVFKSKAEKSEKPFVNQGFEDFPNHVQDLSGMC